MQGPSDAPHAAGGVLVQHRVPGFSEDWVIAEQPVPEAAWHDRALELLKAILEHFIARTERDAAVFRNIAVRVQRDRPSIGFDPDLVLVEPAPPGALELPSLRLWEPGHAVPALVVEVVSPGHPYKDYSEVPDQCAALGVRELVVFDPLMVGPRALGGPKRLQVWHRAESGVFERVACGDGPFASEVLGAWLVVSEDGRTLRIADDEAGLRLWPTPAEAERAAKETERAAKETERAAKETERAAKETERAAKETERAAKEAERAAKEQALARVAELEQELLRRGG